MQESVYDRWAYSSYVLDGNGKIYSWGENNHGVLGLGDVDLFGDDEITKELDKLPAPKCKKQALAPTRMAVTEKDDSDEEGQFDGT